MENIEQIVECMVTKLFHLYIIIEEYHFNNLIY